MHPLLALSAVVLVLSSMLGLIVRRFFELWLCLELNLLSFLLFMGCVKAQKDALLLYFVAQRIGSLMILTFFFVFTTRLRAELIRRILMTLALRLKLGVPPLHGWLVGLFIRDSWETLATLRTVQKILPVWLFRKLQSHWAHMALLRLAVVGAVGVFNSVVVSKMLAYSSLMTTGWVIAALQKFSAGLVFLAAYGLRLLVLVCRLRFKLRANAQVFSKTGQPLASKVLVASTFWAMGGLPPLLTFYLKLRILHVLCYYRAPVFILLVILAPLRLYGYLRAGLTHLQLGSPMWSSPESPHYTYLGWSWMLRFILAGSILI